MPYPGYTNEEVVRLGEDLYDREIRPRVEADHRGQFLVMDIVSGEYEIADEDLVASDRLVARKPDAVMYGLEIGSPVAYYLGGYMQVQPQ
jgi:hypothetical protein